MDFDKLNGDIGRGSEEDAARMLSVARGMDDPAEKEELNRVVRAEAARASMTPIERERYETFETKFRIELARHYGDRLSDIITEHLVRILPLDHRAIQAMVGTDLEVPRTAAQWRTFVSEITEREPLAILNLDHSDAQSQAAMRENAIQRLSPQQKINMSRDGSLEEWLQEQVTDEMHRRAGVG